MKSTPSTAMDSHPPSLTMRTAASAMTSESEMKMFSYFFAAAMSTPCTWGSM